MARACRRSGNRAFHAALCVMTKKGTVFIVDDDCAVRDSLGALLSAAGFCVQTYPSAEDFLQDYQPDRAGCLLLDVAMPGMSGPALADILAERGSGLPVVFLTAYGDIRTSVEAMKKGALDFLEKPVDSASLVLRVEEAVLRDQARRAAELAVADARQKLLCLTPREQQVMMLAIRGLSSKAIGRSLRISHRTAELHRARAMKKLEAESLLDVASIVTKAGVTVAVSPEVGSAGRLTMQRGTRRERLV